MKSRAAKYFERTFNYTLSETKLAKPDLYVVLRVLSEFSLRPLR